MNKVCIYAVLTAFVISAVMGPIVIPFLRRLKCGQTVRDDGPSTHLKKSGTPTMGGVLIVCSVIITSLMFLEAYPRIAPILFLTMGFGFVGFLDDYIKVVCKSPEGLKPWQKMLGQIVVTAIFAYYIMNYTEIPQIQIPWS